MAESIWSGFMDTISGEEKLLKRGTYQVEVAEARPHRQQGEVRRGIFVDLKVLKGPEKGQFVNTYIGVPEPGNRKQGYWYNKKMLGFGDLTAVYESMPDDLEGGLEVLCAAITGRQILADLGPGTGDYSNRNALHESKPVAGEAAKVTSEPVEIGAADVEENAASIKAEVPGPVDPGF